MYGLRLFGTVSQPDQNLSSEQIFSAIAAALNVLAIYQRANLYSAYTSLTHSNNGLMVSTLSLVPFLDTTADGLQILANLLLLYASFLILTLQSLLHGPLSSIETEKLYSRFSIAVIEMMLTAILLKLEIDGCFMLMFVAILSGKVWTWMGEGKSAAYEQQPWLISKPRCLGISMALALSVSFNVTMLIYAVNNIQSMAGPRVMILVALEFGVMTTSSTLAAARFALSSKDMIIIERQHPQVITASHEETRRQMSYVNVATGMSTLTFPIHGSMVFDSSRCQIREWSFSIA